MSFSLIRSSRPPVGVDDYASRTRAINVARAVRDGIPVRALMSLIIDAALTGMCKRVDPLTGEEVLPAQPITPDRQLDLAMKLVDKRIASARVVEEEAPPPPLALENLTLSPEEIKRMPLSELGRVVEATYTVPVPHPEAAIHDSGE